MKWLVVFTAALLAAATLSAQTKPPAQEGVPAEWDVRTMLGNLQVQAQHLKPVLDQVHPDTWVSKGAPEAYVTQWKSVEAELRYLLQSSESFFKQPDRLPLALDTYFRMQSISTMLGSLVDGVRKYQNPAVGDLLQAIMNENGGNLDHLREYIRELATEKEQEFQIADREAQRCRGALMRESSGGKKK